jgi:hypothetical protein
VTRPEDDEEVSLNMICPVAHFGLPSTFGSGIKKLPLISPLGPLTSGLPAVIVSSLVNPDVGVI